MNEQAMQLYYKNLFPSNLICEWLSYGQPSTLQHRQFNFTLDINGSEVYERYISFASSEEMRRMLNQKCPLKIDIGAVMREIPKKGAPNAPLQRQFVLDIDIDDYDQVRTCCKGATLCQLCWKLMRVACHILYRSMQEDFGFKHMMFVFSGRRGLHLWVCDPQACQMEQYNRRSIMNYLYLVTGNEQSDTQIAPGVFDKEAMKLNYNKKEMRKYCDRQEVKEFVYSMKLHPSVRRSLEIIQSRFLEIFDDQKILNHPQHPERRKVVEKILQNRSPILLERVQQRWERLGPASSSRMYACMLEELDTYERYPQLYKNKKEIPEKVIQNESPLKIYSCVEEEIQLTFMYPRLDVNVSTTLNHLLKCPFSVHPKSKKLSIPFRAEFIDSFDPDSVVTLEQLTEEYSKLATDGTFDCYLEPERVRNKPPESIAKYTNMNESILVMEELVGLLRKDLKSESLEM